MSRANFFRHLWERRASNLQYGELAQLLCDNGAQPNTTAESIQNYFRQGVPKKSRDAVLRIFNIQKGSLGYKYLTGDLIWNISEYEVPYGTIDLHRPIIATDHSISRHPLSNVSIPWWPATSPTHPDSFYLLNWRSRATKLIGRDLELSELHNWAHSERPFAIRFLTGGGGSGKTRLAAECAQLLSDNGWLSGFLELDQLNLNLHNLPPSQHIFLTIDYPEIARDRVSLLIKFLLSISNREIKIRVLLLSRRPMQEWESFIDKTALNPYFDSREIALATLSEEQAVTVFHQSYERLSNILASGASPRSDSAIISWLRNDPFNNKNPLFISACALYHVISPAADRWVKTGREIIVSLVRIESNKLNKIGASIGWSDPSAKRIFGLAALSGRLTKEHLIALSKDLDIGIALNHETIDKLRDAGWWDENALASLSPDILSAEMLSQVIEENKGAVIGWIETLMLMGDFNLDRVGRVMYDISTINGNSSISRQLPEILSRIASGSISLCHRFSWIIDRATLPHGLQNFSFQVSNKILEDRNIDSEKKIALRAGYISQLYNMGEFVDCIKFSEAFADDFGALDIDGEDIFKVHSAYGRSKFKLREFEIASEILETALQAYRSSGISYPELYIDCMKIFCSSLCYSGNERRAVKEACSMLRETGRLASEIEGDMLILSPKSLHILYICLYSYGLKSCASHFLDDAINKQRILCSQEPWRSEWELAHMLRNKAMDLDDYGDINDAASCISESIEIYERVYPLNPLLHATNYVAALTKASEIFRRFDNFDPGVCRSFIERAMEVWRFSRRLPIYDSYTSERLNKFEMRIYNVSASEKEFDNLILAEATVAILLVRGTDTDANPIYAYVGVSVDKLDTFMAAQEGHAFFPEDFGIIVRSGHGDPSDDDRRLMEEEYGFNHDGMLDIIDAKHAREVASDIVATRN